MWTIPGLVGLLLDAPRNSPTRRTGSSGYFEGVGLQLAYVWLDLVAPRASWFANRRLHGMLPRGALWRGGSTDDSCPWLRGLFGVDVACHMSVS